MCSRMCICSKVTPVLRTKTLTYAGHAAFVVAQSYKTRTGSGSGLKGTGTGADPDEVQQKSQEIIQDIKVRTWLFCSVGAPDRLSDSTCLHVVYTHPTEDYRRGVPKTPGSNPYTLTGTALLQIQWHDILGCPAAQLFAVKHATCCAGKVGRHGGEACSNCHWAVLFRGHLGCIRPRGRCQQAAFDQWVA